MFRGFVIIWIVLELLVFVGVAKLIGVFPAILLIILSMIIGGAVMRIAGFNVAMRAQEKAARGEAPTSEMLQSAAIVMGGLFMMIPGFITSVIGLLLLIPVCREGLARWLLKKQVMSNRFASGFNPNASNDAHKGRIIEGESVEKTKKKD